MLFLLAWFVVEVVLLLLVGEWLGVGWTLLALVGVSLVGTVLLRAQGRKVLAALREAQAQRRHGGRELADGALGGLGAALIVLPGFASGLVGLLLVLPPTRALVRPLLEATLARRVVAAAGRMPRDPRGGGTVIDGEVLDPQDSPDPGTGGRPLPPGPPDR